MAFGGHCNRSPKIFLEFNVENGSAGAWVTLKIKRRHEFMLKQCKKLFQEFRYLDGSTYGYATGTCLNRSSFKLTKQDYIVTVKKNYILTVLSKTSFSLPLNLIDPSSRVSYFLDSFNSVIKSADVRISASNSLHKVNILDVVFRTSPE